MKIKIITAEGPNVIVKDVVCTEIIGADVHFLGEDKRRLYSHPMSDIVWVSEFEGETETEEVSE